MCKSGQFRNLRQKSSLVRSSCHWQGSSPFGPKIPMSEGLCRTTVRHEIEMLSFLHLLPRFLHEGAFIAVAQTQGCVAGQLNGTDIIERGPRYMNLHDPPLCQSQRIYTSSYICMIIMPCSVCSANQHYCRIGKTH